MQPTESTVLLVGAPEQHSRRCVLVKNAIDAGRWPAAASSLRMAATLAQDWADNARSLANWCDAQTESGRVHSVVPATLADPTAATFSPAGPISLEALEAGLMALAHHLGRDHAVHTRRALNGVILAQLSDAHQVPAAIQAEAEHVGTFHDSASLEPADAA